MIEFLVRQSANLLVGGVFLLIVLFVFEEETAREREIFRRMTSEEPQSPIYWQLYRNLNVGFLIGWALEVLIFGVVLAGALLSYRPVGFVAIWPVFAGLTLGCILVSMTTYRGRDPADLGLAGPKPVSLRAKVGLGLLISSLVSMVALFASLAAA